MEALWLEQEFPSIEEMEKPFGQLRWAARLTISPLKRSLALLLLPGWVLGAPEGRRLAL